MQHTSAVWYRRSVSPFVLVASVAVFLTATANLTFFDKISQTYPIADNLGFVLTIAVVLFGAMLLITTLLSSYRYVLKPVLILLLIMGAVTSYFTDTYGTVYDTTKCPTDRPSRDQGSIKRSVYHAYHWFGCATKFVLLRWIIRLGARV